MVRWLRNGASALVLLLGGVAFLAMPHALSGTGICEELCGECYWDQQHPCAYLDGCSVSKNECYFLSGECHECPPH